MVDHSSGASAGARQPSDIRHATSQSSSPSPANNPSPATDLSPTTDVRPAPQSEAVSSGLHPLVAAAMDAQVARNREHARQVELYAALEARCDADHRARNVARSRFHPTPAREAAIEMGAALGVGEHRVSVELLLRERLLAWFPEAWQRCRTGALDLGRARLLVEAAEQLAHEDDIPLLAASVESFLDRHDSPDVPLCTVGYDQLARAVRYRRLKFEQRSTEASFTAAFRKRQVWLRHDEHGMASLGTTGAAHDLLACDYRLTLIARKRCEDPDDDRTLAQMRSDTLVDLVLGRLTVGALDSELEEDATSDGVDPATTFEQHEVGRFARPVINVTVPVTALAGATDEPGTLSGEPIPADLARHIARDPRSTWYRLLTDPAGDFVELSTHTYAPTPAIWRHVTARDQVCMWPDCRRAATRTDLDHRLPFPAGPTSTSNLDSLCGRHHRVKHSDGYRVHRSRDGGYHVTTPRGTRLHRRPSEQPVEGVP